MVSNKSKALKRYFLHYFGKNKVKSYYGVYFKKNWLDRTFRFYINGDYGSFFSSYLKELSFGNWCFIDIGANQGLYSIIASQNQNIRK